MRKFFFFFNCCHRTGNRVSPFYKEHDSALGDDDSDNTLT